MLLLASVAGVRDPPVDGAEETPAGVLPVDGPAGLPVPVPAAVPPVEPGDCGDEAAGCEAGVEASPLPVDEVLTDVEPAIVGVVVVLFVSVVTTAWPPGWAIGLGAMFAWADSRAVSDGLEPPDPLGGAVVATGFTVVLVVAGAAVVGGVVATVVGLLPADVP
jgi:hypothetical protein